MLMTPPDVPLTDNANLRLPEGTDSFDLSDLSSDDQLKLKMAVAEFRSSGRRLVGELYIMTTQLCMMRDLLGERFRSFAEAELGLNQRTVSRYLHMNKVLNTHFSVGGQVNVHEVNAFTQRALALLSPTTDLQVIEDLREVASKGGRIDEKLVIEVMNKAEEDAKVQLASTQADLTLKTKQLEEVQQQRELERARSQRELESSTELLRRAEQRRTDLEGEIEKLRSQATEVRYESKEVVPAGYASIEEAIDARTQELDAMASQRDAVADDIATLTQRQKAIQEALEQTNASAAQFLAMKEQADALISHFPIALLKSLSEKDPVVKGAIVSLGQTMILFGEQLAKAGA